MSRRKKILVFSPNNAIWQWSAPLAMVARESQSGGANVTWVRCNGTFGNFCMAKLATGAAFLKSPSGGERVCRECRTNSNLYTSTFGLKEMTIEQLVSPDELQVIDTIVQSVNSESFDTVIFHGIPAGKLSMYEFVIQLKKSEPSCSDEELPIYRGFLRNALLSIAAANAAISTHQPDVLLLEQTGYSVNRAWQLTARAFGVPSFFFSGNGFNIAHIFELGILAKDDMFTLIGQCIEKWPQLRSIPCLEEEVMCAFDHFEALFRARGHVYSAPKAAGFSIAEHFKIRPDQRLLVATTSSYDELLAAELAGFGFSTQSTVFADQVEWLQALIAWMAGKPDLFLIIRIHPRERMPSVFGKASDHFKRLQESLKNVPSNVAVNWPEQKLSMYDLAEEADVILNAWSSVGLEMAFLGLPVVTFAPKAITFPMELNYSASTKEAYFVAIENALAEGWSFMQMQRGVRWYATMHRRISLDLADVFPFNTLDEVPLWSRVMKKGLRYIGPLWEKKRILHRARGGLRSSKQVSFLLLENKGNNLLDYFLSEDSPRRATEAEEFRAIQHGVRRLLGFMHGKPSAASSKSKLAMRLQKILVQTR